MANTESRFVPFYVDDMGKSYDNLTFRVEEQEFLNLEPFGYAKTDTLDSPKVCAQRYFSLRKLKATIKSGQSIEVPVPVLSDIPLLVQAISSALDGNLACLELLGEQWTAIPPAFLGGDYSKDGIEGAKKPPRETIHFEAQVDGLIDTFGYSISLQTLPDPIFKVQQSCVNKITQQGLKCSFTKGFTPRHYTGRIRNTSTGGEIKRKIFVDSNANSDIKTCGREIMGSFNCLGYTGNSMDNALEFYIAT